MRHLMVLSLTLLAQNIGFSQYPDYDQTIATLDALVKNKVKKPEVLKPLVETAINDILSWTNDWYQFKVTTPYFKEHLLAKVGSEKIMAWRKAVGSPDSDLLWLTFATRVKVMNNFTDHDLLVAVNNREEKLKRKFGAVWKNRSLQKKGIHVMEQYPPDEAAAWVHFVCVPWFKPGELPYGAPRTTWASESFANVIKDIRLVEFAKQSVTVKLLANMGKLHIPTVTYAEFKYSGMPSIPIDLSFQRWVWDDIPELQRLVSDQYYGIAAAQQLRALLP